MACPICARLRAFFGEVEAYDANLALAVDHLGNAIGGGSADETISAHTTRVRDETGARWAKAACVLLTWAGYAVCFVLRCKAPSDHCAWALTGKTSLACETMSWGDRPEDVNAAR